ncbi:LOW QUALITY PROTEIN: hypothetical protein MAR_014090 [Mya arenaria]|uniref:Uncharacterized protein n=1 Tax=Mya arenaria TaxID=6604 RepID=A0ABY7G5Q8_MYAAR|nr:LOW QUALITY PROTEIN: hypothetical protein MAR_014090 [Mya arenaria]
MEGSHTAQNISGSLAETKTRLKLPECLATTDNAANENKAFQLLCWNRFGCFGHRINLIKAISVPCVKQILTKARKLVTFFLASSNATDKANTSFPSF